MKFIPKILAINVLLILIQAQSVNAEVSLSETSAVYIVQDSTLNLRYNKANKLFVDKKYSLALKEALSLLDESKMEGDNEMVSKTNYLIGNIFYKTRTFKKSLKYLKKSLNQFYEYTNLNQLKTELKVSSDDYEFFYTENLLKLGGIYQKLMSIDTINSDFYRDSTMLNYNKILDKVSLNKNILDIRAKTYINLSAMLIKDKEYDSAKVYAKEASDIHKSRGKKVDQAAALGNLGSIYLLEDDFEGSKGIYFEAIGLIKNDNSASAVRYKATLYYNLAWAMYNLKDYEAYDKLETAYDISDGLRDSEMRSMIEAISAEYDVETAKKITRKEAQSITWILGISSFFIIVLLVFYLNQYKLRQKNLGLELSKQELMQQQKIEKIKSESQVRILNATIDGKEKERKQIAETLHDSVSALLSSANLHLQACKKQFNGSTPIEVDKSQSIINEASQKIRDLSHTLVSSILLKFGLSYAIKDIAEKYSNSQLHIDYETKYIQRYDQRFEIKLYNIIQEFVNNILKHSNATHASIVLVEKNKKLKLTIRDNGDGFDKDLIPEKDGLGINQIDARIQMMQGKFQIESGKGKGTLINIELPVFEKEPVKFV